MKSGYCAVEQAYKGNENGTDRKVDVGSTETVSQAERWELRIPKPLTSFKLTLYHHHCDSSVLSHSFQ